MDRIWSDYLDTTQCQRKIANGNLWHVILSAWPHQFSLVHVKSESTGSHPLLNHWDALLYAKYCWLCVFQLTMDVKLVIGSVISCHVINNATCLCVRVNCSNNKGTSWCRCFINWLIVHSVVNCRAAIWMGESGWSTLWSLLHRVGLSFICNYYAVNYSIAWRWCR